jgi:hypothetical protein
MKRHHYIPLLLVLLTGAALVGIGHFTGPGFSGSGRFSRHQPENAHRMAEANSASNQSPLLQWTPLFDPTEETDARLDLARQVDGTFNLAALLPWLRTAAPLEGRADQESETLFFVFNEIIETHRRKEIDPPALAAGLTFILKTADLHPVIRDYAAQHLGLLAHRHADLQPAAVETFCEILESPADRNQPMAGTIIHVLGDLRSSPQAEADGLPHQARVDLAMASLASIPDLSPRVRISLLQNAAPAPGTAAAETFLNTIRDLSQDPAQPGEVRLAAIGTLGRLGNAQDLPLLHVLNADTPFLATAATAAADRLRQTTPPPALR